MRLTSDAGDFVELEARAEPGDADLPLVVRVSLDGFVGMSMPWVERHDWFSFTQALVALAATRSGEARVASMSPGELELTVKSLDRLGHMGVEGVIGKREYDRDISLRFSVFAFEPGQLAAFAVKAQRISEGLGGRSRS